MRPPLITPQMRNALRDRREKLEVDIAVAVDALLLEFASDTGANIDSVSVYMVGRSVISSHQQFERTAIVGRVDVTIII